HAGADRPAAYFGRPLVSCVLRFLPALWRHADKAEAEAEVAFATAGEAGMTAFVRRPVVARDTAGAFTLDADMLAGHFGWPSETLRDFMRRGMVASIVERGEGEDQGKWRLSVRCGN